MGGVIFRFLFAWTFDPGFSISTNLKKVVLSAIIGLIPAFIFWKMGMENWTAYIMMVVAGFLSQYVLEWLNKRKG